MIFNRGSAEELCQGPDVTVTGCASGVGRCQAGVGLELRKERRGVQKWWQERLPDFQFGLCYLIHTAPCE